MSKGNFPLLATDLVGCGKHVVFSTARYGKHVVFSVPIVVKPLGFSTIQNNVESVEKIRNVK